VKLSFGWLGLKKISATQETLMIWLGLTIIVWALYSRILSGYFIADDYAYLVHLLDAGSLYVQGEELKRWFFDYNGTVFLRPIVQWLWLTDFIAWGRNASGYYLTNVVLHALNTCLVYALTRRVFQTSLGAMAASLLFALHPIHADSVSWISDRVDLLCALFVLISAFYYVLFRQNGNSSYVGISIIGFAFAVLTKESAIPLPLVLFAYDMLFVFPRIGWQMLKAQLALLTLLLGYFGLRVALFHGLGGYGNLGFVNFGWELFVQYYTLALMKPYLTDLDRIGLLVVFALVVALVFVYRDRKGLWLGIVWMILMLLPAGSAGGVAPRLVYIPSIGLAIAQGAILTSLVPHRNTIRAWQASIALLVVLAIASGLGLYARVDDWTAIGQTTASIQKELQRLHPSFPIGSQVFIKGIPRFVRGFDPYAGNFPFAIKTIYHNTPYFGFWYGDEFPVVSEKLEQSYFLEYHRRTIIDRSDVQQILLKRRNCLDFSIVQTEWNFTNGVQDWEAWNHLTNFEIRDGELITRSFGEDPYMASPPINVPTLAIGKIEIEMEVRTDDSNPQRGQVYWLVDGASDFSPDLQATFPVQPDGKFHIYSVDLGATGLLPMENRIVRLRIDPVEAPAEIAIKIIRVLSHCTSLNENRCQCE